LPTISGIRASTATRRYRAAEPSAAASATGEHDLEQRLVAPQKPG
jgi:hypothetical protein